MTKQRAAKKTLPTTTKRAQKGSKKPTDSTKKVQKKTPKVKEDPLQVALARCRAMIPYNKEKKLGQLALYYLSERYKLLAEVKCPEDTLPADKYVVNQILCDKFLGLSPLSRNYLVCWEGHEIPEWVHQSKLPPTLLNDYQDDGIVPEYAYNQLQEYHDKKSTRKS